MPVPFSEPSCESVVYSEISYLAVPGRLSPDSFTRRILGHQHDLVPQCLRVEHYKADTFHFIFKVIRQVGAALCDGRRRLQMKQEASRSSSGPRLRQLEEKRPVGLKAARESARETSELCF